MLLSLSLESWGRSDVDVERVSVLKRPQGRWGKVVKGRVKGRALFAGIQADEQRSDLSDKRVLGPNFARLLWELFPVDCVASKDKRGRQ